MRSTGPAALALPATALVGCIWLVVACGLAGATPTPSGLPPSAQPTASPTTAVTRAPVATSAPSVASPTSSPPNASPTTVPTVQADQPPAGLLTSSGDPVTGHLGTFCWAGLCSDEFELPAKSSLPGLDAEAGQPLSFSLSPGAGFVKWSASYSKAKMADLVPLGSGGAPYDPDSSASPPPDLYTATFAAPPSGDWVVVVALSFANGSTLVRGGDANYSWHVIVP